MKEANYIANAGRRRTRENVRKRAAACVSDWMSLWHWIFKPMPVMQNGASFRTRFKAL